MASLIIMVLPFASLGGVIALFLTGEYLSVPASVGFIALWGIAVLNGVVLVSYIRGLRQEGLSVEDAVVKGATLRFRPVMMTATVALLGRTAPKPQVRSEFPRSTNPWQRDYPPQCVPMFRQARPKFPDEDRTRSCLLSTTGRAALKRRPTNRSRRA